MRQIIILIIGLIFSVNAEAQNYYKEYPINISIATNGSQSRIECSTFDSVLQTTVSFQTEWVSENLIVTSSVLGKLGYTFWNGTVQVGKAGFVIYDSYSHEFVSDVKIVSLATGQNLNVICGPVWIEVVKQIPLSSYYSNEYFYYRYNTMFKKWIYVPYLYGESTVPDVFSLNSIGNTDRLKTVYDHSFVYYDPVKDTSIADFEDPASNINWWNNKYWEDCNVRREGNYNYDLIQMYDPLSHQIATHPRNNLISDESRGIFFAYDSDSSFKKFFTIYDLSIQQWITDSVYSATLTNIIVKDRVVAWRDISAGLGNSIVCMVYNPISHTWIKDSIAVTGTVTGFQIQNGTVKWNDSNGSHVRGYNSNTGWGNYNTTILLNFHLTDFTSQGYNMIHVRNYSIGSDSIYFSFGDGVVSSNKRNVLWHSYNESGTYDVCIHDSTGTLSWCQQVTLNVCSYSGLISVANDILCQGDSTVLSLQSNTGSIQWQRKVGNSWVDETGVGSSMPNYQIAPVQSTSYRAKITNGSCLPTYSNEQFVKVFQTIGTFHLSDSSYTRCASTANQISVDILNYSYQWQKNDSVSWINIAGATLRTYTENSNISTQYRVLISSGTCFMDTSDIISVTVIPAPAIPVVTSGSTCGPGNVVLQATSNSPTHYWTPNTQDTIIHVGSTYTPYITTTTNFRARSVDGQLLPIGYANTSIGTIDTTTQEVKGIRFYCSSPGVLEYVYVYPQQTGNAILYLRKTGTQTNIASVSKVVQGGSGPFKLWLKGNLLGGITYDLVSSSNSIPFQINTDGISYPINAAGVPISILGFVDSTFHSTNDFYNFYDIQVTTGCKSSYGTATATYYQAFNVATISVGGPLSFCAGDSVKLTAPPNVSFNYEWKRNGITESTAGNIYWAKTAGSYTAIVSNSNCSDTSSAVNVRVPCIPTFDPISKMTGAGEHLTPQINVVYISSTEELEASIWTGSEGIYTIKVIDPSGREVLSDYHELSKGENKLVYNVQPFSSGIYVVKVGGIQSRIVKKFVKF